MKLIPSFFLVSALPLLGSCDPFSNAYGADEAAAVGSRALIGEAIKAARKCGAENLRFDPLDDDSAVLLLGKRNTPDARHCIDDWLAANAAEAVAQARIGKKSK